jgi:hypothetical protein
MLDLVGGESRSAVKMGTSVLVRIEDIFFLSILNRGNYYTWHYWH